MPKTGWANNCPLTAWGCRECDCLRVKSLKLRPKFCEILGSHIMWVPLMCTWAHLPIQNLSIFSNYVSFSIFHISISVNSRHLIIYFYSLYSRILPFLIFLSKSLAFGQIWLVDWRLVTQLRADIESNLSGLIQLLKFSRRSRSYFFKVLLLVCPNNVLNKIIFVEIRV